MKCRYKQCKLGGEVEKSEAVRVGSFYYHKECNKERELKKQIEDFYYSKFQNKELIQQVRMSINRYIHDEGHKAEYISFVLNEDIRLNSIFGLTYYLNNEKFISKYNTEKAKLINFDIDRVETEDVNNIKYKTKKQNMWGDMICR